MEQDIKSIMELLQKGVITPEEAETMIKALTKGESFTDSAARHAKSFGSKVGESIDEVTPKMKSMLKNCFEATASFSQKMAEKLNEEKVFEEEMFEEDEEDLFDEEDFGFDVDLDEEETSEGIIDLVTKEEVDETTEN